jgi:DNA replication protein DnaC
MAMLEKASKLVIDDIGTEYSDQKGFVTSFVDGLINERYANLLPTVITTNLRVETFTERYGERVARRVRTVGTFVSIATAPYSGRPTGGQDGERT